jgi:hydrogenase maturation protease
VVKISVRVNNRRQFDHRESFEAGDRSEALLYSLVSTHLILGVGAGEFVSLLEFPEGFAELAEQCNNIGTWPVLVGDHADTMLSSPIILYDNPQIAPESAGNLYDSTEIDEILSLRILTLTDDEKREMRETDDRTREILERTENMPQEQLMKLHGVLRGLTPAQGKM